MRFYSLEEKEPEIGSTIIIKVKDEGKQFNKNGFYYYTVEVEDDYPRGVLFTEACGEQYCDWEREEILGWTTFEEMEKDEIWHD